MMSEIERAAKGVADEHQRVAYCAGHIKNVLGEGESSYDGVTWYFRGLQSEIKNLIDKIEESSDSHALRTPSSWCNIAADHADAAANEAAKLIGVKDDHARALIDVTADTVTATNTWALEITDSPEEAIPPTVIEHLRLAMNGLDEAIATVRAKGQAIKDQADSLAHRATEAAQNFTI